MRALTVPAATHRGISVFLALTFVVSTTVVGAPADSAPAPLDAEDLVTNGEIVEAALANVGLDAAWRSAIDLHPAARFLTVDYRDGEDAVSALIHTSVLLAATTENREEVVGEMRATAVELDEARISERSRTIARNRADAYFHGIDALTQSVAIDVFAGVDPSREALLGLDGNALVVAQRNYKLTNTTLEEMMSLRAEAQTELAAAVVALELATADRLEFEATHAQLVDQAADLAAVRRGLDDSARAILPGAAEAFALASVPGQPGMTPRALDAYLNAELTMNEVSPSCVLSWRTIAAVSSVEGLHGEYGNRRLEIDGRPNTPIIGIALDGETADNFGDVTANISDTDNGRFDGDPVYDRAVGPLQFIPETWARWQLDGDGDGKRDPQDIDDAALTAAAYLCSYGSLRYWPGWSTAIFGYNHSAAYVNSVKSSLDRVQRLTLPEFDSSDELRQRQPWGTWVPIPEPPPPEEEDITGDPEALNEAAP